LAVSFELLALSFSLNLATFVKIAKASLTMTRNNLYFIVALCAGCSLISCSESFQSSSWKAQSADFRQYKTFAWAAPGDTALTMRRDDKLFAGTIYLYANKELKKKGMVFVKAKPDAVFMFDTQVEDRTRYSQAPSMSVGFGYGGPGYYVGGMAPVAGGQITAVPFMQGRLIIEMFDARSGKLLWRGWADRTVDSQSDMNHLFQTAIRSILYKLPVKQKI
jgi:hypothetical protein